MTEQTPTTDQTGSGDGAPELSGLDLARVALQQARLAAKNNGVGEARAPRRRRRVPPGDQAAGPAPDSPAYATQLRLLNARIIAAANDAHGGARPGDGPGRFGGPGEDQGDGLARLPPGARRAPIGRARTTDRPGNHGGGGAADRRHARAQPQGVPRHRGRDWRRTGSDRGGPSPASAPGRVHGGSRPQAGSRRACRSTVRNDGRGRPACSAAVYSLKRTVPPAASPGPDGRGTAQCRRDIVGA